jgi:hypothetical protein
LAQSLRAKGFSFLNVSAAGTTTADSIARFNDDVAPRSPDYVVLATSVGNESIATDVGRVRRDYLANTSRLLQMVEAIGATPILTTPYPNSSFSGTLAAILASATRQMESEGVVIWDFWNATDDGSGKWLPGLSNDGTHPSDIGHLHLFESIPLALFTLAPSHNRLPPPRQTFGSWTAESSEAAQPAIIVSLASPAPSWSAAFWAAASDDFQEKTLFELAEIGVRVRRIGTSVELLVKGEIVAAAPTPMPGVFHHLCVTYKYLTRVITLYIDGLPVEYAAAEMGSARLFALGDVTGEGPGIQGDRVAQFLIYRTPLSPEDVAELAAGRVPTKSMEAHLPLAQSPARPNQNAAPTVVDVVVNGSWRWVPDGPRTFVNH